jgi:hypothetical protein
MQKIAWDITWDNLGAEHLQTQQDRGRDPMDSKRYIVAACSGLLERKPKVLIVAMFGAVALLGVIVASAAPPSQSGLDTQINRHGSDDR